MERKRAKTVAVVGAILMIMSVLTPAAIATDDGDLEFEVTQDEEFDATVTVTENGEVVEGANVTVEPYPPGRSYNGSGEYVTDGNGTVELPAPRDDLLVTITVSDNDSTMSDRLVLKADDGDEDELDVDVAQNDDYTATVTVAENDSAAAGANVTVEAVESDESYRGAGEYVADENGTVTLPAPAEDVTVEAVAAYNNSTGAATADLAGAPGLEVSVVQDVTYNATVTVTDNDSAAAGADVTVDATSGNYSGEGDYTTDENGTVGLPAPAEDVDVAVTAEFENDTANTTTTLLAPGEEDDEDDNESNESAENFGQELTTFIENLGETEGPRGLAIADFVLANNPGNPPDHAGPPDDHPLRDDGDLEISTAESDGNVTVTVTDNGSAAANATVEVDAFGGMGFDGEGTYTADDDGSVTFALPDKPTMVTVTAEVGNDSASDRVRLSGTQVGPPADAGPPGDEDGDDSQGPPDHAGPPDDDAEDDEDGGDQGPPDHAGPPGDDDGDAEDDDGDRSPPEDAGPPGEDEDDEGDQGPPEDAGPPGDDDEDDEGDQGPPEDAGPPGDDDEEDEEDDEDEDNNGNGNGGGNGNGNNGNGNGNNGNGNGGGNGNNGNGNGGGNGGGPP